MDYRNPIEIAHYEVPPYSGEEVAMQQPSAPNQLQWVPASSTSAAANTGKCSKKNYVSFSVCFIVILVIAMAALILGIINTTNYLKETATDVSAANYFSRCHKETASCTVRSIWNQFRYFCVTERIRINATVSRKCGSQGRKKTLA